MDRDLRDRLPAMESSEIFEVISHYRRDAELLTRLLDFAPAH